MTVSVSTTYTKPQHDTTEPKAKSIFGRLEMVHSRKNNIGVGEDINYDSDFVLYFAQYVIQKVYSETYFQVPMMIIFLFKKIGIFREYPLVHA